MSKFTISRIARALGVPTDTVRHYREYGLLHPDELENGYFSYGPDDLLQALLVRELRSQEAPLSAIKTVLEEKSIQDYCDLLDRREAKLRADLELIRLQLARLRETRVYASCGLRILGGVEEFDGPATWAVPVLDAGGLDGGFSLERWTEHFPFTYVSATIPLDALNTQSGTEPYPIAVGSGALEKYVQQFRLPLGQRAFYQSGGHFIRTCIATEDVLSISPADIAPLLDYAKAHHYRFASHTGGRLLFIGNAAQRPLYYVLVWVRVDPA